MEQYNRVKGSAARILRHKAFMWTMTLISILLLGGALIVFIAGLRGQSSGVKVRDFSFQSVVTSTDIATVRVTTTIIPTVIVSVFHLTTTSMTQNFSSGLTSFTPSTFQTVPTTFAGTTVTNSGVQVRNPISTASLAGIFVSIVCFILIVGGLALYVSRKLDIKKLRFWPIGTRVRVHGIRGRAIQLQQQNTSHVQFQTAYQTLPVNTPHQEVQTNSHQASQTALDTLAQTVLPSLPQTPERTIPRINVSPASEYEVVDAEILSKNKTRENDKSDEH